MGPGGGGGGGGFCDLRLHIYYEETTTVILGLGYCLNLAVCSWKPATWTKPLHGQVQVAYAWSLDV